MAQHKARPARRAIFRRDMYPGVRFCETCFCHHNWPTCPFTLAPFNPSHATLAGGLDAAAEAAA